MSTENSSVQVAEEEKNQKNKIEKKLKKMWYDKRSWVKRLLIAAAAVFCACFTFTFFGPLEVVAFNAPSLVFEYRDIAPLLGVATVLLFVVLTLLISLLKGRIYNYTVAVVFAVTSCGYIQGNFLNGELGALTGDPVNWLSMKKELVINCIIWLVVFLLVFFAMYLSKKIWEKIVVYISMALVAMQLVPCVAIFTGMYNNTVSASIGEYWLSTEGMCEYSSEDNVFVFVLDRLDYDYIDEVVVYDRNFFDRLDGFVAYTNAISTYGRTWPALNHLLTGYEEGAYMMPYNDYFVKSWTADGKHILRDLTRSGYEVGIYAEMSGMFANGAFAEEYVDNLARDEKMINASVMLEKMMSLSAYRYSPIVCKPFYWTDTNYYNLDVFAEGGETVYDLYYVDESRYIEDFKQITAEKEQKCFKFYHFMGPHSPYYMNEDGTRSDGTTSSREQTMGSFNILFQIFDRMKELGIYEDATIIITADHGSAISDSTPVVKPTRIGLFYKPSGSSESSLTYSSAQVSTQNIPATLIKAVGGDYEKYGRPLDEIGEDEEITRVYYKTADSSATGHEGTLYTYNVCGDAANFDNWILVKTEEISYPFN